MGLLWKSFLHFSKVCFDDKRDVGCWMLDVGCWIGYFGKVSFTFPKFVLMIKKMLDVGCWILDVGFWNLDLGIWILEFGSWNLEFGIWILEFPSFFLF